MKKLKGEDFKKFFLRHGEKVGAFVIGLLALLGVASANWATESRTPQQMMDNATETGRAIEANVWDDSEKEFFAATPDVRELARQMQAPKEDIERFHPTVSFFEPLNPVKEKRSSVTLLAAVDPEVSLVQVPIVLTPEEETVEPDEGTETTDDKKPDTKDPGNEAFDSIFGPLTSGAQPGGLGSGAGGYGGGLGSGLGLGGGAPGLAGGGGLGSGAGLGGGPPGMGGGPGRGGPGIGSGTGLGSGLGLGGGGGYPGDVPGEGEYGGAPGEMGGGYDPYGGLGYGGSSGYGALGTNVPEKRVEFRVGASVRLVFDIREQRKMLADALHLHASDTRIAEWAQDFVDLHIERKQARPGPDPWGGEWEALPLEDIAEVLEESLAFDLEIVHPGVVQNTITMPLPRRAAGRWDKDTASHRRLVEFVLSEEEQELIRLRDEELLKLVEERKAKLPPSRAVKKGFAGYMGSGTDLARGLGGSGYGMDEFMGGMMSDYGEGEAEGESGEPSGSSGKRPGGMTEEQAREFVKTSLEAVNRLLLVRFMDFTVDRGHSYRYRVRLEARNPNFNLPVEQLEQPEVASQPTVMSEWSTPSEPVYVPMAYRYYVKRVEGRPQVDEFAEVDMYYENVNAGTPTMGTLRVPVGIRIGGQKDEDIVDLSKNVLDRFSVDYRSKDVLCSVIEAPKLSASEHPEIRRWLDKLPRSSKGVPDRMIVLNSRGELITRALDDNPTQQTTDQQLTAQLIKKYEEAGWRRDEAAAGAGNFSFGGGGYGGGEGEGDYDPYGGDGMGRGSPMSRKGNRNRRGGGSGMGYGPGMGSGMGYGPGMGGPGMGGVE